MTGRRTVRRLVGQEQVANMRVVCRSLDWSAPPVAPTDDECHIWSVVLSGEGEDDHRYRLTADEIARADRFKIARPRTQFVIARSALRFVLGGCLGLPPGSVELVPDAHGKPEVPGHPIRFNVSHSGDLGLVAVCRWRVGVDVEQQRIVPNADGLVERFFSTEERDAYRQLPTDRRAEAFLHGWTCKEAVLKAVGIGLRDVQECWVELDPDRSPAVRRLAWPAAVGRRWELATWRPADGYLATVAVESKGGLVL